MILSDYSRYTSNYLFIYVSLYAVSYTHLDVYKRQDMSITGDEFTLVVFHEDRPGAISLISQALSESDINIASMRVFRKGK